ncbi:BREX-1 system adenine-specific DNA-methyltransferase PglX [Cyanobium sp. Cruz CV13-4-11]|uniref:BREX-1 system adenine-specific DNA-methyltransferase PglX n=1 Tax=unclassified Cyanobium TaxID=2627006 RepID=UPI0020CE13F2|nr:MULTISPECIES: BREX-1 system adenine-specific DNA-methyltransferase PglX [unclassified Cyanobium]MCP9899311.1 BREX-1 system adenine-specific DNA-methyltransferase PglX [Cyanobium sp. Cruz CV11-17]MCP9917944.1 BREX-1 system adenine-specific DNA-methyltransferase PglX [Cyanobium sp. Cruz CV13-4-11]
MPVNTAALKTFAPAMRRQLIEALGRKLDLLLHQASADTLTTAAGPIAELRQQEATNRQELLERVAYSWFNRLAALRYLDARLWHPFGARVLMPQTETETQPELLKLLRSGSLPAELQPHTDEARLQGLLDGRIPTATAGADPQGEVYRELILAVCRSYHQLLPNLFEGLDDASELLLPDDLLSDGSIAGGFRSQISDSDCEDVEILGWLYQFYIAEKKDEVMARKKAVPTEDIPAVTQLFTPHWIVRYLVENSLGRLWLLNRPESKLRDQMPYYIEGETETDFLRINKPEDIKLLDPACGSGHMLTYAFDLLSHIYTEEGYASAEIPRLILQHNLYGLDICPRAAQLAGLALVLKAREQSRRFFQPAQLVQSKILVLQDVRFGKNELNDYIQSLDLGELFDPSLLKLLRQFEEAKTFGSLIQPCLDERSIAELRRSIGQKDLGSQLFLRVTHLKVLRVIEQSEALTQRYHVVVANPPYMGGKGMNPLIKQFLQDNFSDYKADLFSAFIARSLSLALSNGYLGFMSPFVWMFISSYEELRKRLISQATISTLVQLEYSGFDGAVVPICTFTLQNKRHALYRGGYIRLSDFRGSENQGPRTLEAIKNPDCGWFFHTDAANFYKIPGSPIAYWLNDALLTVFSTCPPVEDVAKVRGGMTTGENDRFLRLWHEVSNTSFGTGFDNQKLAAASGCKWFPYNKGGPFRRWYGNQDYVVNWANDGQEILSTGRASPRSRDFYFREALTYTATSSSYFAIRYSPVGFLFDAKGSFVAPVKANWQTLLGLLNSKLVTSLLKALNPTIEFQAGDISRIPFKPLGKLEEMHSGLVQELVQLGRVDWNNYETSWDFRDQPLLRPGLKDTTLEASWRNWEAQTTTAIRRMQELETENNRLFISAYGLDGELQPEVPEDQITLARADPKTDIAALLSYATGCMMGRYSLAHPGLILANAGDTLENYDANVGKCTGDLSFQPDRDGIIPVLDGEWFEDDIVARSREFLRVCFPASSLNTDLAFIETSLGKDLRKYFCTDFYKDHLQTYKKRPIYWLVQSPAGPAKGGFACLIYLHRYTKDTLNLVLNNYFRPYLQKLEARQAQLGLDQLNDAIPSRDRTAARKEAEKITKVLKDCQAWEQDSLLPLAQQRIELDLDDGVKVNYLKLQDVLAPIPGLAAKED